MVVHKVKGSECFKRPYSMENAVFPNVNCVTYDHWLLSEQLYSPGWCFLRVGGDLNGQLHRFLQGISGPLINWLHWLDINTGDHQVVSWELKTISDFLVLIQAKYRCSNNSGWVLNGRLHITKNVQIGLVSVSLYKNQLEWGPWMIDKKYVVLHNIKLTRFWPNSTSVKIKLTPPLDSYTTILLMLYYYVTRVT